MILPQYQSISPKEAVAVQKELQSRVQIRPLQKPVQTLGGADISFNRFSNIVYAGIVVLDFPSMEVIERTSVVTTVDFPYIPGLLAFRELPAIMEAWERLSVKPDVLVTDGHGLAHPRRLGIASHFGIMAGVPSFGCAKTLLTGKYVDPENELFAESDLTDKDEKIGIVLRSKKNCKPIFISAGHLITHQESVALIKQCIRKYRVPEPTRQAHLLVNEVRREKLNSVK